MPSDMAKKQGEEEEELRIDNMYVMQPASRDCSIEGKKLVEPVVVIIEH